MLLACGSPPPSNSTPSEPTSEAPPAAEPETADAGVEVLTPTPKSETEASIKGISEKIKYVNKPTPFGNDKADARSFTGAIFRTQPGTTQLPDFGKMRPIGLLATERIDIPSTNDFTGFPGIDKARKTEFAIRYEAALNVGKDANYTFRLVSDDGAKLFIDDMEIIDNDGLASGGVKEGKRVVHLVKATHLIRVDYFQADGGVALQLLVTPPEGEEAPLRTNLF